MTDAKKVSNVPKAKMAKPVVQGAAVHNKKPGKRAKERMHWGEVRSVVEQAREVVKNSMAAKNGSFMVVSTDEKGKVTTAQAAAPSILEAGMAREYMKTALGDRPFKAILTQQFAVQASTANTALSTSLAADLAATNEWSSFSALFDEVRCIEYKARTLIAAGGSGIVTMTTVPVFVMATQFTTTVSLASLLVATHHVGPIPYYGNSNDIAGAAYSRCPVQPTTEFGYVEVSSGKMPVGAMAAATATSNAPIQGDWLATTATSGQGIVGYINQYSDALGGGVIAYTRTFGYYYVEFRLRQ